MEKEGKGKPPRKGRVNSMKDLEGQIKAFEAQNPQIAEALRLFGITQQAYEKAMALLYEPRVYATNSTTGKPPV